EHRAAMIHARRVGGQEAAAVGAADLQVRELVERALEDEMHQRERGFERIADDVAERARALHTLRDASRLRGGLRMDEDERLQLLGLLPERTEPGGRYLLALDAPADRGANQAKLLHAALELLGGKLRILQCDRRIADEATRESLAHLGDLGGLQVEHAAGK